MPCIDLDCDAFDSVVEVNVDKRSCWDLTVVHTCHFSFRHWRAYVPYLHWSSQSFSVGRQTCIYYDNKQFTMFSKMPSLYKRSCEYRRASGIGFFYLDFFFGRNWLDPTVDWFIRTTCQAFKDKPSENPESVFNYRDWKWAMCNVTPDSFLLRKRMGGWVRFNWWMDGMCYAWANRCNLFVPAKISAISCWHGKIRTPKNKRVEKKNKIK